MDETQKAKIQASREKLVEQIHRMPDFLFEDKQRLIKVIDAIIIEQGTRFYTSKTTDYMEFIDLQIDPNDRNAGLKLCLKAKSYDPYGGSATCRMTNFPDLEFFLNYVSENKGKVDVQITNAYNSIRKEQEEQRKAKEEYQKIANARSNAREKIKKAKIPDFEKRRLEDLLDTLLVSNKKSMNIIIQEYFEEKLVLGIEDNELVNFRIKRRQLDYAGATALRLPDEYLSFGGLLDYVSKNKEEIDKQIQKNKSRTQEEINKFYELEQEDKSLDD